MSELVGNSPRNPGDIPGNAHRERVVKAPDNAAAPAEPQEPIEKIVEGKVTTRKLPWYKRMVRSMVADDVGSMREWIFAEVIVPSVRNLLADTIKGSTDRVLYGQSRARRGIAGGVDRPGLRTRYDKMHDPGEPRRMLSRDARARHDFDEVVLETRSEAVEVIEAMIDYIDRYGSVTVANMYDFLGVTGSYADRNYGWTDLRTADVRQIRGGWLLDLPRPELLR